MELKSGLFRMLDETLAAYLATRPERVTIRLDWAEGLDARIASHRAGVRHADDATTPASPAAPPAPSRGRGRGKSVAAAAPEAMPGALQAMIDDRREEETAAHRAVSGLPASTRREIRQRADTLGIAFELSEDGQEVRLVVEA